MYHWNKGQELQWVILIRSKNIKNLYLNYSTWFRIIKNIWMNRRELLKSTILWFMVVKCTIANLLEMKWRRLINKCHRCRQWENKSMSLKVRYYCSKNQSNRVNFSSLKQRNMQISYKEDVRKIIWRNMRN